MRFPQAVREERMVAPVALFTAFFLAVGRSGEIL